MQFVDFTQKDGDTTESTVNALRAAIDHCLIHCVRRNRRSLPTVFLEGNGANAFHNGHCYAGSHTGTRVWMQKAIGLWKFSAETWLIFFALWECEWDGGLLPNKTTFDCGNPPRGRRSLTTISKNPYTLGPCRASLKQGLSFVRMGSTLCSCVRSRGRKSMTLTARDKSGRRTAVHSWASWA